MKKKLLVMTLLAALVLGGCGSNKPNSELDKIADEIQMDQEGASEAPTEAPTEDTTEEDTTEGEEYFLTFEATTTEGEAWNSDKFANSKLTMINVWATYCNPCLSEMPDLGELAAEYDPAQFQIVGVVCDVMEEDSADNIDYAKQLITETKANYPHLLLNDSLYASFVCAVSAVPTTFFVDQNGALLGYMTGAQSKENWKTLIDRLLSEQQ